MHTFNYESQFKIGPTQVNSMLGVSARVGFTSFFHKTNTYLPTKSGNSSILLAPRSISSERLNESEF